MSTLERRIVTLGAASALVAALGCVTGRGSPEPPVANRDWGQTLAQAEVAAADHRYAEADRLLAEYARLYPGSEGAIESAYWRGVFLLDPTNHDGSPQVASALLETYANGVGARPHRVEADVMRRVAERLEAGAPATTFAASGTPSQGAPVDHTADLKAKDTEIQRLKDELAKANDELERIKRRLTAPTKP